MATLHIIRGISGSGKSTLGDFLQNKGAKVTTIRSNRDKIRECLFGSESDFGVDETLVTRIQHETIKSGLYRGFDVVDDNTNLHPEYLAILVNIANGENAEVKVHLLDVPWDIAWQRVLSRASAGGRMVPLEVIKRQHAALEKTKEWTP